MVKYENEHELRNVVESYAEFISLETLANSLSAVPLTTEGATQLTAEFFADCLSYELLYNALIDATSFPDAPFLQQRGLYAIEECEDLASECSSTTTTEYSYKGFNPNQLQAADADSIARSISECRSEARSETCSAAEETVPNGRTGFMGLFSTLTGNGNVQSEFEDDGHMTVSAANRKCILGTTKRHYVHRTCYFDDSKRIIDFVIAFRALPPSINLERAAAITRYRELFEGQLLDRGLQLEREPPERSMDGQIGFLKVHAPWDVLCRQAQLMEMKLPIQRNDIRKRKKSVPQNKCNYCGSCNNGDGALTRLCQRCKQLGHLEAAVEAPEPDFFTMRFDRQRLEIFHVEDKDTFFTPVQRMKLVNHLIERVHIRIIDDPPVPSDPLVQFGLRSVSIYHLIKGGVYRDMYVLHDCNLEYPNESDPFEVIGDAKLPYRRWLRNNWASYRLWYKDQPLHQIRAYLGEPTATYFAWMGFYVRMLFLPAILSVFCLLYGLGSVPFNYIRHEICNSNITICRLCPHHECALMHLSKSCTAATINAIVDTEATVFFGIFISVWAVCFLEFWNRKYNRLKTLWNITDSSVEEELIHPEYFERVKTKKLNPVSGEEEPYLDRTTLLKRRATSTAIVVACILVSLCASLGILTYRVYAYNFLIRQGKGLFSVAASQMADIICGLTGGLLNVIVISIMESQYVKICFRVTGHELLRTRADFERSFSRNYTVFQFFNYYTVIVYLAFIKGKFFTSPKSQGILVEQCPATGCLLEVSMQLIMLLIGKQIIVEKAIKLWQMFTRKLSSMRSSIKTMLKKDVEPKHALPQWESDFRLNPNLMHKISPHFRNYFEMTIQYGFMVIFATSFPLCALLALIANVIEVRGEAREALLLFRRPIPMRTGNIGMWQVYLTMLTKMAVFTNAIAIAFTSNFVDRILYSKNFDHRSGGRGSYLDFAFSSFDTEDYSNPSLTYSAALQDRSHGTYNVTPERVCHYKAYRNPFDDAPNQKYHPTLVWWIAMLARLAVILCFVFIVKLVQAVIAYAIPEESPETFTRKQRERYLAKQAFTKFETKMKQENDLWDRNNRLASVTGLGVNGVQQRRYNNPRLKQRLDLYQNKGRALWMRLLNPKALDTVQPSNNPGLKLMTQSIDNLENNGSTYSRTNSEGSIPYSMANSVTVRPVRRRRKTPFLIALFKRMNIWC